MTEPETTAVLEVGPLSLAWQTGPITTSWQAGPVRTGRAAGLYRPHEPEEESP